MGAKVLTMVGWISAERQVTGFFYLLLYRYIMIPLRYMFFTIYELSLLDTICLSSQFNVALYWKRTAPELGFIRLESSPTFDGFGIHPPHSCLSSILGSKLCV